MKVFILVMLIFSAVNGLYNDIKTLASDGELSRYGSTLKSIFIFIKIVLYISSIIFLYMIK